MPFFILSIALQVAFVIHVLKTGRNTTWIWIIVMLPIAGAIAYLILEVLPELTGSKTGRAAARKFEHSVNPNKGLNQAATDLSISDTVENSSKLADEMMKKDMYDEAKKLYLRCLRGLHENDPVLMSKLAAADFELGNFKDTKAMLDDLIEKNPDFKSEESHLLYARSLEALNETDAAIKEYEVLSEYYTGPEAAFYFAMLSKETGDSERAQSLLKEIVKKSETSGAHYNSIHKNWINRAKKELKS